MKLAVIFVLLVGYSRCQTLNDDVLNQLPDLFTQPTPAPKCTTGLCLPGYDTVPTSSTESSMGYIEKCGEGKTLGKRLCVNYEYCDGRSNTIVQNGITAGFGVIDIRFGENRCGHPLEVCCQIPAGGLSPDFDPTAKPSTTTPPPTASTTTPPFTPSYCGIRNQNGIDFKIVGNNDNEAEYGEFPWMAAVIKRSSNPAPEENFSLCGGSLISPSVVLTVAHCVSKYTANDIKVRAGEWDSKTTRERLPYQERNVANIISHKDFVAAGVFNDFALLVLETPMDKAEHIGTVCLPDQGQTIISKNCFVSGWGKNVFGSEGRYQDILKKIELPIVPVEQCQAALRKTRLGSSYILHDSFLCAGGEEGKDACSGDGGSPLVCPDPNNPTRYLLTGMVAWGIGCGSQNVPGVYADVAKFRSWIDQQMERLNLDTSPYIS